MWWLVCFLCCASKFCADGRNVPTKKFHQLSSCKKEHQTSATGGSNLCVLVQQVLPMAIFQEPRSEVPTIYKAIYCKAYVRTM